MSARGNRVRTAALALCAAAWGAVPVAAAPPPYLPAASAPAAPALAAPTASEVHADELGLVPVLMYHRIVPVPESIYDRTPADFRAELERLAAEGYVPITAADYAAGRIDVPAGRHPVVLTFDDASPSQLTLGADGEPTPECAVGILLDVAARNPGFRPVASLYVNADPFGEPGGRRSLRWLHEHGFEIGNHTLNHTNLAAVSDAQVQREIAAARQLIVTAAPGAAVTTLALPFGVPPNRRELGLRGSADGISYDLRGVMLVGANPAPSPYSRSFDPLGIPRIRSQARVGSDARFGSAVWLDELAARPASRYTSDGDPDRISFPAHRADELGSALDLGARSY